MAEEEKKIHEEKSEKRVQGMKKWLKNPYNALLVGILVIAFAIRLYFFVKTSGQTLWYDEADYMATAKHWAFDIPYMLNVHRPPLFQLLGALGYMIGFGEIALKLILILLPSVALVYFVYLLGKEMYDEKIGLIAAFLTAISWTFLFWTNRFQPDFFSMCFQVLAVLFMWKYWKTEKTKPIVYAGIFAALGFLFKVSGLLVPLIFVIFIFCKDRFSAIKNKDYYWFSLAFLATLAPYFIWSYLTFGTPFSFAVGYASGVAESAPFGWYNIKFYYTLTENVIFALFIIGLLLSLKFLLYTDILIKDRKKCFDAGLFSILVLIAVSAFYIFWIRGTEDRWVFLWLPFIFMMAGNALMFGYKLGKKYSKIISIIVIFALLAWGAYAQLNHGKEIIELKKDSYLPVREAALWLNKNSESSDRIFSVSYPQTVYYSEREVLTSADIEGIDNADDFDAFIQKEKPRYVELSIFESHPQWMYEWPETRNDTKIVQAYFDSKDKSRAVLIIYEINYNETD